MTDMAATIPFIDLHAHFAMHLNFPPRPTGDNEADKRNATLMRIANLVANYGFSPRVTIALAQRGHVCAFGSVLYDPADEFCKPQEPFKNLLAQIDEVEANLLGDSVQIVRSADELERVILDGKKIAVFTAGSQRDAWRGHTNARLAASGRRGGLGNRDYVDRSQYEFQFSTPL